ncbi:MAG: restriction endonuclease subunit S [Acidobacteria bacterium]|nr:restriction endonuclease subunit S [Acidobacteriota bacterium]
MDEWATIKLGDISEMCLGKMLDKAKNKGEFHPYLSNIDVRWGSFDLSELRLMRFEDREHERYGLKGGDLVVCEGGEPGRCAIWKGQVPDMKIQKALHRVRIAENYSNSFIYYRMLLAGRTGGLAKHFIGSTIKHLTGDRLREVEFAVPSLETQQKIAAVLSALDAKIEVNNRINAELEAMAKTLYDYWFVQFDFPDENREPYKSSGGKMTFNPDLKRNIPDGWDAGTLTSLANIIGGSTPPKEIPEYFSTKGTAWITPKDLSLNGNNKFISNGETDVTEQGIKKTSLQIMPRGTVLMSSRAPVGYLAISTGKVTTNQGFKSFVPKEGFSTPFVFYTVKNLIPAIKNNSGGSTFKEVSTESLRTIPTPLPDRNLIENYAKVIQSTFERQELLETENQRLSTLRDWLLPMLMNGQVTVK